MNRARTAIALALASALIYSMILAAATPAHAGSVVTDVFNVNACDQYLRGNPRCTATPQTRAERITERVQQAKSNVVTLQEVCWNTYETIRLRLGSSWSGDFKKTVTLPLNDYRCDGGGREWGIAVLARGPQLTDGTWSLLPNDIDAEQRFFFCANFQISAAFRVCTSHFSLDQYWAGRQAQEVGRQLSNFAATGGAILLGVDANINSRSCTAGAALRPIYIAGYNDTTGANCLTGAGVMYEADQPHTGGNWTYTAATTPGGQKLDHIFFNYQKWWPYDAVVMSLPSGVSDHYALNGWGTLSW